MHYGKLFWNSTEMKSENLRNDRENTTKNWNITKFSKPTKTQRSHKIHPGRPGRLEMLTAGKPFLQVPEHLEPPESPGITQISENLKIPGKSQNSQNNQENHGNPGNT